MKYDTAGMAAENQYNLVTDRLTEFMGSETGRMISEESLLLDGAGTGTDAEDSLLCPFAARLMMMPFRRSAISWKKEVR